MDIRGKRVLVAGLGVSGSAAARFLASRGAILRMTDIRIDAPTTKLPPGQLLLGGENPDSLRGIDFVVVSPGVPRYSSLIIAARSAGIPLMGELELASRFVRAPILAVTGTNGKSTVTVLLGKILKNAGMRTFVGGNLGTPLIEAAGGSFDAAVVEVSSYQLETIEHFKPRVGIHLNLTDDHLDRYHSLDEYGAAKARLFENQDATDWAILNGDDANVWGLAPKIRSRVIGFGAKPAESLNGLWISDGAIQFRIEENGGHIGLRDFVLPGEHNRSNAMAAAGAALVMGVDKSVIEAAMNGFRGLPHRLEFVTERDGVTYIDDSKGTNVDAVVRALAAVNAPTILIAGGVDKGGDYEPLRDPITRKVRMLVLIGAAREKMRDALTGATDIEVVDDLREAVKVAASRARPGDTVLLSPACSSFDQFKDYAERGRVFQELVRAL